MWNQTKSFPAGWSPWQWSLAPMGVAEEDAAVAGEGPTSAPEITVWITETNATAMAAAHAKGVAAAAGIAVTEVAMGAVEAAAGLAHRAPAATVAPAVAAAAPPTGGGAKKSLRGEERRGRKRENRGRG